MEQNLLVQVFRDLAKFDSCSIANAVDSLRVRLLNEGFTGPGITCRTKILAPMVGVAVTLKVGSSNPPMIGSYYLEQTDWWERIEEAPFPRVLVIEDTDAHPGRGSLVGPVHACILKAMGFAGVVSTGALRGTREFAAIGLHAFSGNVSPSHAYCHVIEMGTPVEIAGVKIEPGEIIHGDRDGIVSIPPELAERIPEVARRIQERESSICGFCNSPGFSREQLKRIITADPSRW
jgi:regulator of RNase E activity RraA